MLHQIMTQYTLKTGLRKFKERGKAAGTRELTQLYVLGTFAPVDTTKITKKHKS